MSRRLGLFVFGIYLGILIMLLATKVFADVSTTRFLSAKPPIVVYVIDSGVDQNHPALKSHKVECRNVKDCVDFMGHGTAITSLVIHGELDSNFKGTLDICPRVRIVSCNYLLNRNDYYDCLEAAIKDSATFVNFSSVGNGEDFEETKLLRRLVAKGTKFITAMGNNGEDVRVVPSYPALTSNRSEFVDKIIAVGGLNRDFKTWSGSNYGIMVKYEMATEVRTAWLGRSYGKVTGTSISTALHTNRLIRQECNK